MPRPLADYRLFLRQFRRAYHTTGAVLPSGRTLCRALASHVGSEDDRPLHVLEVGPGTGSVTRAIIGRLRSDDRLDLVEVNDQFVAHLQERLRTDPEFRSVADRTHIWNAHVEQLTAAEQPPRYDRIVSGLPLNNFSPGEVETILGALRELLAPGGTLSFFQYMWIRNARTLVSGRRERTRLRGIGNVLDGLLDRYEIGRQWIWPNVPPAWVHHVQFHSETPAAKTMATQKTLR